MATKYDSKAEELIGEKIVPFIKEKVIPFRDKTRAKYAEFYPDNQLAVQNTQTQPPIIQPTQQSVVQPTIKSTTPQTQTTEKKIIGYYGGNTQIPQKMAIYSDGTSSPVGSPYVATSSTPSVVTTPTPVSPIPTPGSVASIYTAPIETVEEKQAREFQDQVNAYNQEQFNTETDPAKIYQQKLLEQQAQIDAINAVYADQLNKARIQGQGRLGSQTALQARSGLLGSDIGQSMTNVQQEANTAEEKSIEKQRLLDIQSVYSQISKDAKEEAKANREAKSKGADALLEFYNVTRPALRAKKVSSAVKALVAKGIDINKMSQEEIDSYVKGLGITKDEFINSMEAEVIAKNKLVDEEAKKTAELEKIKAETANKVADTAQIGKMTPYQAAQIEIEKYKAYHSTLPVNEQKLQAIGNVAQLFVSGAIIPNSNGTPFIDSNGFATVEGFKTALKAAQQDKIPRQDFIKQFGNYIAPGLEKSYGLTPAEIKLIQGVLPTND